MAFYLLLSYMPTYLSAEVGMSDTSAFAATTISLAVYILAIFVMGHISDSFGRRRMLLLASVLFIVLAIPLFVLLDSTVFWVVVGVQVAFGILLTMNDGTLASFLSELFPTPVRYTGFALSFNTANALFGGTAPFIATWLIDVTGSLLAPAVYLMVMSAVALTAILGSRETAFKALRET